jgi:ubiquinone/menaquinone biosynthesis C-methylase UbiE
VKLDVGCGWSYRGDVNVDLFLSRTINSREQEQQRYQNHKINNKKRVPNLVCADCHYLPFRDNTFKTVVCSHLLEHVGVNHNQTCRELLRVANGKVVVEVPHPLSTSAKSTLHNKIFSASNFKRMFCRYKCKVWSNRYDWKLANLPFTLMRRVARHYLRGRVPCPIPTQITCEVTK